LKKVQAAKTAGRDWEKQEIIHKKEFVSKKEKHPEVEKKLRTPWEKTRGGGVLARIKAGETGGAVLC